nr:hypothetical transcript [Hymenolepis microstoma]
MALFLRLLILLSLGQIWFSNQASIIAIDIFLRYKALPFFSYWDSTNTTWDYLVLSQSWPPGYCQFMKCAYPRPTIGFNIHGLWAQIWPNQPMNQCSDGPKFNNSFIQDIYEQLKKEWADEKHYDNPWKFWHHEWSKHGVCAIKNSEVIKNQHDYFAISLMLKRMYNFTEIFARNNIVPSNETYYDTASVLVKIRNDIGANVLLHCSWQSGEEARLVEARVCVDKSFKLIDCPKESFQIQLLSPIRPLAWTAPCQNDFVFSN